MKKPMQLNNGNTPVISKRLFKGININGWDKEIAKAAA